MSVTRRGMTGDVPPHPLVAHQGVVPLEFLGLCESPVRMSDWSWICLVIEAL